MKNRSNAWDSSGIHLVAKAFSLNGAKLLGEPILLVLPHDGYSPLVPPFLLEPTDAWHNVGGLNFLSTFS